MDLGLKGKTALVLGGGGGLGGAIAKTLAKEGAQVAVADINKEAAQKTVCRYLAAGGSAMALEWDLADLDAIEPNLAAIENQFGSVDILVNNHRRPAADAWSPASADSWGKYFDQHGAFGHRHHRRRPCRG